MNIQWSQWELDEGKSKCSAQQAEKIGHVRYLLMDNLTNPLPGPDWFGHPRVVA